MFIPIEQEYVASEDRRIDRMALMPYYYEGWIKYLDAEHNVQFLDPDQCEVSFIDTAEEDAEDVEEEVLDEPDKQPTVMLDVDLSDKLRNNQRILKLVGAYFQHTRLSGALTRKIECEGETPQSIQANNLLNVTKRAMLVGMMLEDWGMPWISLANRQFDGTRYQVPLTVADVSIAIDMANRAMPTKHAGFSDLPERLSTEFVRDAQHPALRGLRRAQASKLSVARLLLPYGEDSVLAYATKYTQKPFSVPVEQWADRITDFLTSH